MPIKKAEVGGRTVTVEVEYPVYYIIRHKEMDAEPIAFIMIPSEEKDVGFPNEVGIFLRKNFKITRTTEAEAETYDAMGVAPIMNPEEFAKWLEGINYDIRKALQIDGSSARIDMKRFEVICGEHKYDLSTDINQSDLED